jgi:hypothetical protein
MGSRRRAGKRGKPRFGRSLTLPAPRFPGVALPYDTIPMNRSFRADRARLPLESKNARSSGNLSDRDLMG